MTTLLVTGGTGLLGSSLVQAFRAKGYQVIAPSHAQLDVGSIDQLKAYFSAHRPDIVLHAAAYTQVDRAEAEPTEAFRMNAFGTRNVAVAAEAVQAKLVFISTDYVFDGRKTEPYHEFDPVSPGNVYGRSKLAGEQFVRQFHHRFFIVRTSWLFGPHWPNFVMKMLELAQQDQKIAVVCDQYGSPTYVKDLADPIDALIKSEKYGTYHITNSGSCSWYELAQQIFTLYGLSIPVSPVYTDQYERAASRPKHSVLAPFAMQANDISLLRDWKEALAEFLQETKAAAEKKKEGPADPGLKSDGK
ncbi:MAG: dTDP-4-dehydrorhamnose reductase [Sporolactobacillus sp.]